MVADAGPNCNQLARRTGSKPTPAKNGEPVLAELVAVDAVADQ